MKSAVAQVGIGMALAGIAAACWRLQDGVALRVAAPGAWVWAGALVVAWTAFTAWMARRMARENAHAPGAILVVHASQTGFATELAAKTADALRAGGVAVDLLGIDDLDAMRLGTASRALFVASTTGEGDAPDAAAAFQAGAMRDAPDLHRLSYGVLALGDSDYHAFCAFGRELDAWLRERGATSLFDRVDVDNGDEGALRHWQHHVAHLAGIAGMADWRRPAYQPWRLVERRLLNPDGAGAPCYHVALVPHDAAHLHWQAGDIAEVGPRRHRDDPEVLAHREYSIASIPVDGALHLLVRRMHAADGTPGPGSGWLTEGAQPGDTIALRVRRNAGFHLPDDDRPLLLVGNGTGMAGLRALLKARIARGHRRNWLVHGERHPATDRLHADEVERWHVDGAIERLDLVWSRDAGPDRYVQDRLLAAGDAVRRYVAEGAGIYVCGSLKGMAPGVDAALRAVLGDRVVNGLAATARYRRDVY